MTNFFQGSFIAASAITNDAVLYTGNTKNFNRIQKLMLYTP